MKRFRFTSDIHRFFDLNTDASEKAEVRFLTLFQHLRLLLLVLNERKDEVLRRLSGLLLNEGQDLDFHPRLVRLLFGIFLGDDPYICVGLMRCAEEPAIRFENFATRRLKHLNTKALRNSIL